MKTKRVKRPQLWVMASLVILLIAIAVLFTCVIIIKANIFISRDTSTLDAAVDTVGPPNNAVVINNRVTFYPDILVGGINTTGLNSHLNIYANGIQSIIERYPSLEVVDFERYDGAQIIVQFREK